MSDTGNGATITFATSGFTGEIVEIGAVSESIAVLNKSILTTTGYEEKMPGDLIDVDAINVRLFFNPDSQPPLGTVETITLRFPLPSNKTTAATLAGTGFIASRTSGSMANNQLMEASFTIQFDGVTGPVWTAAT